jgi:ABC-type branched-subunit amino acid transport system ATPase component
MRLCDPVIVLDAGKPIFSGAPAEVQRNPFVLDAYLGA